MLYWFQCSIRFSLMIRDELSFDINILVLSGQISDYIYADKVCATHMKKYPFAMINKCKSVCGLSNAAFRTHANNCQSGGSHYFRLA